MPILDSLSVLFNLKDSKGEIREKFFKAAETRETGYIEATLQKNPDAANWTNDEGRTAMMVAGEYGHRPVIEALLAAGADINAKDEMGMTAMAHAAKMGQQSIVKMLIGMGAETGGVDGGTRSAYNLAKLAHKTVIMKMIEDAATVQRDFRREQNGGRIEVMKPLSLRGFKRA